MAVHQSQAFWEGSFKEGKGTFKLGEEEHKKPCSFASRFEGAEGTNPEELIGAAHAGCFSMALSAGLTKQGYPPKRIQTTARVHLEKQPGGYEIPTIDLICEAEVPGMDDEASFREQARTAKENCPVSKLLKATINLDARLVQAPVHAS